MAFEQHARGTKNFLGKYIFSFDHKVIAKQFLWSGLFFWESVGIMAS